MSRILKSETIGNHAHIGIAHRKKMLGFIDQMEGDKIFGRRSGFFSYQIAEVARSEVGPRREISNTWKRLAGLMETLLQVPLKLSH